MTGTTVRHVGCGGDVRVVRMTAVLHESEAIYDGPELLIASGHSLCHMPRDAADASFPSVYSGLWCDICGRTVAGSEVAAEFPDGSVRLP